MNIKKMVLCMSVASLLLLPAMSIGSPITVISYDYHISLNLYGYDIGDSTYTVSDAGPEVSHLLFIEDYHGWGFSAYSEGNISPFQIYTSAAHMEMDWGSTDIEASWLFIPNYNRIQVDFKGYLWGHFGASFSSSWATYGLIDISDNISLATGSFSVVYDYDLPWQSEWQIESVEIDDRFVFDLSKDKTYKLTLTGRTETSDGATSSIGASFRAVSVPEPATMLLLTSGLLGLAGLRRKFRK